MRYIRFLKTPRIIQDKNHPQKSHIHALITITSDLGDSFLPYDVSLSVELHSRTPKFPQNPVILWKTIHWTAGMRTLPITLPLPSSPRQRDIWPVRVRVGIHEKTPEDDFEDLHEPEVRGVVSAWSAPLDATRQLDVGEKFVERRLCGPGVESANLLEVWEETGESIARHLWDAGITMACHIRQLIKKAKPDLFDRAGLRVLELGTGCGIVSSSQEHHETCIDFLKVGISIAQIHSSAHVYLTDLPEAQEIVERNIANACPLENSDLEFRELNWEDELPEDLFSDSTTRPFDLFVAADCTYNSDSRYVSLVSHLPHAETLPSLIIPIVPLLWIRCAVWWTPPRKPSC